MAASQASRSATTAGLLIGDSVDPDDPDDLEYQERNSRSGFHRGRVRLRFRYRDLVSPWWYLLNIPPAEMETLVYGTGWTLEEHLKEGEDHLVVLRRQTSLSPRGISPSTQAFYLPGFRAVKGLAPRRRQPLETAGRAPSK